MAHEPVALKVTSPALMVHTDAEADSMLNVTALPEAPPVAVTWYVPPVDVLAVELVNVMAWGASPVTLSVRSWVTDLVDEAASFVADAGTVKSDGPALPASGVPAIVAVPLPLSTNVRPLGRPIVGDTGVRLSAANGNPVAVTENDDGWATVNAADDALVITGGLSTVSVKAWVTTPKGLERLRVTCETPSAVDAARVAVPSPLSVKVTPAGSAPATETVGRGSAPPTVTELDWPASKIADAALVNWGP